MIKFTLELSFVQFKYDVPPDNESLLVFFTENEEWDKCFIQNGELYNDDMILGDIIENDLSESYWALLPSAEFMKDKIKQEKSNDKRNLR